MKEIKELMKEKILDKNTTLEDMDFYVDMLHILTQISMIEENIRVSKSQHPN